MSLSTLYCAETLHLTREGIYDNLIMLGARLMALYDIWWYRRIYMIPTSGKNTATKICGGQRGYIFVEVCLCVCEFECVCDIECVCVFVYVCVILSVCVSEFECVCI